MTLISGLAIEGSRRNARAASRRSLTTFNVLSYNYLSHIDPDAHRGCRPCATGDPASKAAATVAQHASIRS